MFSLLQWRRAFFLVKNVKKRNQQTTESGSRQLLIVGRCHIVLIRLDNAQAIIDFKMINLRL